MTCAVLIAVALMGTPQSVIVDTDAGVDDLMAISFLLSRRDISIEAITVANGIAHVEAGAANILGLLELARPPKRIPVFLGRGRPLGGGAHFPDAWREAADRLPGLNLPKAAQTPEPISAADYIAGRLKDGSRPVSLLTLGPLTNVAQAFLRVPQAARLISKLVIMGGAVRVPGNLGDARELKTNNTTAEWNMFVDPRAADIVFRSGAEIYLVPLDATNRVPIKRDFVAALLAKVHTRVGKLVSEALNSEREMIEQGAYYAWDPLAAAALVRPQILSFRPIRIEVRQDPAEAGRTAEVPGIPNARVAVGANAPEFRKIFLASF